MSILGLFHIGNSALVASQSALSVTGNNIANINTPGYSKEDIILSIANPTMTNGGAVGNGVTVTNIQRSYDQFIESQLLGQQQSQGKSSVIDQTWGQVEQVLNESQGLGLSQPLSEFFNAWNGVATSPSSLTARMTLLQKANTLVQSASSIESSITDLLKNTNASITNDAKQINSLASDIASLNQAIVGQEVGSSGSQATQLRDQRDVKLTALAKLVNFSSYENSNGSLTITVGMRNLVSGTQTNLMSTATNKDGNNDLFLDGMNITSNINGGDIGGLIASRDDIQSTTLIGVRTLIASLTQQVNALHTQGFGLDGSTGNIFFDPLQLSTTNNSANATITATVTDESALTLHEYAITFNAAATNYTVTDKQTGLTAASGLYTSGGTISVPGIDIVISNPVAASDQFSVSPLTAAISNFGVALSDAEKIAAASTAAGLPGDNGNANQLAQLNNATIGALGNDTFSGYYSGVVTTVGAVKQGTSDSLSFDNNLLAELQKQRDSVSSVSLDEEASKLILYQRSYEAGAQVVKVADQLLQTLLNM